MDEVIEPSTTEDSQETQETQEATGLLDSATPEEEVNTDPKEGDDAEADYEAMAKSWSDLRKQISQGKHKAPKDGVYDAAAFGETPEDDPVRSHVMSWAKENQISQAALDTLVGEVVGMNQNSAAKWGTSLVQKGIWGKDDFEEFKVMGGTAKGISALEKLRSSYEGALPIDTTPVDGAPSKEELYAMVGDEKYQTDPVYRAKVEKAFAQNFTG